MRLKLLSVGLLAMVMSGCGGGGSSDTSTVTPPPSTGTITLSGKITYDLVPTTSDYTGLDYNNITQEAAKLIVVESIDSNNQIIASTTTDDLGNYFFTVPVNTQMKIRVSAKMLQVTTPNWDVKVVNQNNSNALYVMEGALALSGTTDSQRNLNAPSGWGVSSYTSTRVAAPFAMLDSVYSAMQTVLTADPEILFPPLVVNWYEGSIDGTYYTEGGLFIYGDEDFDTDEYDDHVIAHEWGHYYEDKFSRSDSVGGAHSGEDVLDIRVAFGEGWGNAFSGMALDDPVYFDTYGVAQSNSFDFNVESGTSDSKGWFSESSIERILYDLYDTSDDGSDTLSLGFAPIHKVFTGAEKITPAFTSIFTFIRALKDENSGDASTIDTIVSSEEIAPIVDIYGTGRINRIDEYPYYNLNIGESVSIKTSNIWNNLSLPLEKRNRNKLDNHQYIRFTITTPGMYTIKVLQTNGTDSDPDFFTFNTSPFNRIDIAWESNSGIEEKSLNLEIGNYLIDVMDYNNLADIEFTVSIN